MPRPVDSWLQHVLQLPQTPVPGQRLLVLCRSSASAHAVRRLIARRGGAGALDVLTPTGLALQLCGAPEPAAHTLPDTGIGRAIAGRPGLTALARRHVRSARLARAAGSESLPGWIEELLAMDWGPSEPGVALLERLRASGLDQGDAWHWHRAVAIGFVDSEGYEAAVLDALALASTELPTHDEALQGVAVPDPLAAARVAAAHCASDPEGTLILVASSATALRVRAALRRNGLGCSLHLADRLAGHAASGFLLDAVPWFGQGDDPLIGNVDLHAVLTHPLFGATLPPAAVTWLHDDHERVGLRRIGAALRAARLVTAPLSQWIEAVEDRAVVARLRVLKASIDGTPFEVEFDVQTAGAWDAFDDLVADLLGEEAGAEPDVAEPGTLGALRRFALACGLRVRRDAGGRAVLAVLRDHAAWPASATTLRTALSGGSDDRRIHDGVDVLHVDDYDGRPCRQLLLLDAHDGALSRPPSPDPLLSPEELESIGVPAPRRLVARRLERVRRASALAGRTLAIVSRTDAGGREVVPPIQLDLVLESMSVDACGVGLEGLVESEALTALAAHPGAAEPVAGEAGRLAGQASAEWARAGRAQAETVQQVGPWLGSAGVPAARLPDRTWSVTALFDPLATCPYKAFTRAVLDLRPADGVSDELDPREVGIAAHAALEQAADVLQRRPRGDEAGARKAFLGAIDTLTTGAFDAAIAGLPTLSDARATAARGLRDRWRAHWSAWAEGRIRRPSRIPDAESIRVLLEGHPAVDEAVEVLQQALPDVRRWALVTWVAWAIHQRGDVRTYDSASLLRRRERGELAAQYEPALRAFLHSPQFRAAEAAVASAHRSAEVMLHPVAAELAELRFGTEDDPLGPVELQLGDQRIAVAGAIDRISRVDTPHGPLLEVVDYKSGTAPSMKSLRSEVGKLLRPQLVVYALVLASAAQRVSELDGSTVAALGYDFLRTTHDARRRAISAREGMLVDAAWLEARAARLGEWIARARQGLWPLEPDTDSCPVTAPWAASCECRAACRFRR